MIKPRKNFHFKSPIQIKRDWMIGLTSLELYNSIFIINEEKNKFELYTDTFNEFSFTELNDELEEILNISNMTDEPLQDEIIAPRIIQTYKKPETEMRMTDGYMILLMGCARSPLRDFESYLRVVVGLDEENIHLILKQYNANFVTYEIDPGIYTTEDLQETVYPLGDHEGTLQIECEDLNKKTKLISTRFGLTLGTFKFDEKSFLELYWILHHIGIINLQLLFMLILQVYTLSINFYI